jgi:hypothetical protein
MGARYLKFDTEMEYTDIYKCCVDFFIIKPTRCTNFSNLFWNETLHVLDSSSIHHQELFTVHSAMVYVIQVCRQLLNYTECTVNNFWWWKEELSETCRISFQNKFEKLVYLVGFIIKKFVTMHVHMNVKAVWIFIFQHLQTWRWFGIVWNFETV